MVKKSNNLRRILQNRVKRIRLFLLLSGILLVVFSFYFSFQEKNQSKTDTSKINLEEVVSFAQEPIRIDEKFFQKKIQEKGKSPPVRIIIPNLRIDLPVKEARVVKGYWEVFEKEAGWGLGSAYPGEKGNQVIFAHAKKGMFLSLKEAKIGDIIYVLTKDKWFDYSVVDLQEVTPDNLSVIKSTFSEEILTLYTCSGFSDSKRFIVVAKRNM